MSSQKKNDDNPGHHDPIITLFTVFVEMAQPPELEGPLFGYALAHLRDFHLSKDAVQNTGIRIAKLSYAHDPIPNEQIQSEDHAKYFNLLATKRTVEDMRRALRRCREFTGSTSPTDSAEEKSSIDPPSPDPSPEAMAEARELEERRKRFIEYLRTKLSTSDWKMLYAFYFDNQPGHDIASRLGIDPRALHTRLYRIRKELRDQLGGDFLDFFDP